LKQKREKEEDERIRALPPKEREDVRKRRERLSGEFISPLPSLFLVFCFLSMACCLSCEEEMQNSNEISSISLLILGYKS